MAKTIKFNLILDNQPVRNIDDLKNNFSIEDMLDVYKNGLLQRWLSVRGYNDYLNKVNSITAHSNTEIIQQLIKIFEMECDDDKIKESIAILEYVNEQAALLEEYKKANYQVKSIIDDYHVGYESVIMDIIENKDNMPKIKANIQEIEKNYMGLFNLNYKDLYETLIEQAPLAVFAILMNDGMRSCFLDSECYIHGELNNFIQNRSWLKEKIGEELKIFKGDTEAYWKDIEPQGKKYMIIRMENGNYVRNAGKFGEELSSSDINGAFVILDGIDYKSRNANHELLYMEV
ncbi:hypothetical protein [Anoxybacillus flavithermus]|uniref:hypothetical protein n=1 Tax=Anoxybacillus flavithermus TaxID=33934 RepID=UPI001867EE6E|nr:hypothetical protein [Anoxybacillus flavithermus]MBE2939755.1 hypothetical protein [Anoxybacillus flavithermus]MBE2942543.1 hypothetical protein [Anoxybacillus flavithermus]MBE2950980.1 hypothetical protein [Anoxybacillus flavithermus]MBE2953538.1 hypothetical protein [Anoxybacillus flavithermus]MBE2958674.1 hypothetical protein [Anoxybacillus flavithermus]